MLQNFQWHEFHLNVKPVVSLELLVQDNIEPMCLSPVTVTINVVFDIKYEESSRSRKVGREYYFHIFKLFEAMKIKKKLKKL